MFWENLAREDSDLDRWRSVGGGVAAAQPVRWVGVPALQLSGHIRAQKLRGAV